MKTACLLSVAVLASILTGCIVIPIPSKAPYPADRLAELGTPGADKQRVRRLFGQPKAVKSGGSFWFYATVRERAGVIAGTSSTVLVDYEWLGVQFDDADRVIFYEFNDDTHGCLSNGICHMQGLYAGPRVDPVMTAPTALDGQAKQYQVEPGQCAVYVYLESARPKWASVPVNLFVDGRPYGTLNHATYLFIVHPEGEIRLQAYQYAKHKYGKSLACSSGKKYYITAREGLFTEIEDGLESVPTDIGAAAVQKRRLALPD